MDDEPNGRSRMIPPEPVTRLFDAIQGALHGPGLDAVLALRDSAVEKPDGSYVTQGDLLVQRTVQDLIAEHVPDATLISEEMATDASAASGWVMVLDPIDGTENFTSGLPMWGLSLSCFLDGAHLGSLIGAPELGRWLRTGQRIERFHSRIRGLSSSLSKEDILGVGVGPEYRMLGCCVVNMMAVVQGSFLSFENPKGANSWDILGGLNLAMEHGLRAEVDGCAYDGRYLPPGRKYRFKVMNDERP